MKNHTLKIYRSTIWLRITIGLGAIIASTSAYYLVNQKGIATFSLVLIAISTLFVIAFVDIIYSKIELRESQLIVRNHFKTHVFDKNQIERIKRDGGSLFLFEINNGWIKIPDIGLNAQSTYNTLVSWHNKD